MSMEHQAETRKAAPTALEVSALAEVLKLRKALEAVRFNLTVKGAYAENSIMIEGIDEALSIKERLR